MLEANDAVNERKQRVVGALPDVVAGMPLRAALANDDVAGLHGLAAVLLHAAILRIRIATVARGADAFLVSHISLPSA